MLQSLLEDRFRLKLRRGVKEVPVYALLASGPGRLGPGLTAARQGDCVEVDPSLPLHEESKPFCGFQTVQRAQQQGAPELVLKGHSVTLNGLARALAGPLQRPVIDETQVSGKFDVTLEYAAGDIEPTQPGSTAPSIFTAVQEQLGLKLESRKGPMESAFIHGRRR